MHVRLSTETDRYKIEELIRLCFGERQHSGAYENLSGRYLLALQDEQIVAMTGLSYSETYNGYEIDWTCTHPEYRNKGIMHDLFKRICSLTDEDIYCSCWRIGNSQQINLSTLMQNFVFKEIIKNKASFDSRYNCRSARTYCVYAKGKSECRCYEDLWLRKTDKR